MCEFPAVSEGESHSDQKILFRLTLAEVRRLRKVIFDVRFELAKMDNGWKERVEKLLEPSK